ncbi:HAD-IA family hydrolase [Asticcacaulis solisilvae]|uniref:HAD-IA family hydrolase n=1 Tax=Asticcacaulis solisilvae TaxID=1217274 RepID=UPI003FD86381
MDLSGYILAFDLDGTLVDTAPDIIGALNQVLREEGIKPYHLDEARPLIGRGAMELLRRGFDLAGHPLAPEQEQPLLDRLLKHYEAHIDAFSTIFDGLIPALDALERRGARFAVCTNKHTYLSVELLKKLKLFDRFGTIRGADSVPNKKPDSGHLIACVDDMGGDLSKTIMVGDSETDFMTAKNAGVPCILVSFGYSERPIQELDCDVLIDHYDDFIAAVDKVAR